MCLGIPGRVLEKDGSGAVMDIDGVRIDVRTDLTPEIEVGDYGLVHAGFVIQRIDEEEAMETLRLLAELSEASRGTDAVR